MARGLRTDRDARSPFLQALVLLVAMGVLIAVFYVLYVKQPPAVVTPRTAETGDTVDLAYVGTFGDPGFADSGRVFDTSLRSVALDNVSYPKALSFSWRATWTNLTFEIGSGSVIKGFDEGALGMKVGDVRRIVVPPAEGYGPSDPAKVFERPLLQEVPARAVMNDTAFRDKFGISASDGIIVTDPFWRWNVTVTVSGNVVTTTNSPSVGDRVRPYGAWDARVVSIDDAADNGTGIVYVQHDLTADDAVRVLATDGGRQFIVTAVDAVRGVYVADYNQEVVGRTLVFDVTLNSITRP